MAIDFNVPSQVRPYANLAAFPVTGAVKTIYIAEDTNNIYRWAGSAYVEISVADLVNYVPTTRTLTINGTTQDLSADRTFTISTGITIGTTAITSGTVGRVLFEGTGNVVQESANMTYDNTNLIFTLGSTATRILNFRPQDTTGAYGNSCSIRGGISNGRLDFYSGSNITELRDNIILLTSATGPSIQVGTASINLNVGGTRLQVAPTTGNILIGTTTDAGFKLDVNGTARVNSSTFLCAQSTSGGNGVNIGTQSLGTIDINQRILQVDAGLYPTIIVNANNVVKGTVSANGFSSVLSMFVGTITNHPLSFSTNDTSRMRLTTTGNLLINTTTDAGYKLDVNGTARFSGTNYQVVLQTTSNGIIKAQGGYQNTDGSYTADGNLFLKAGIGGSGNLYITPNNGNTTAFGLFANGTGFNIGLGLSTVASASFQINSTTQGFLPPRMTTTQINAIVSPADGLQVYNTTISHMCVYQAGIWVKINHSPM